MPDVTEAPVPIAGGDPVGLERRKVPGDLEIARRHEFLDRTVLESRNTSNFFQVTSSRMEI